MAIQTPATTKMVQNIIDGTTVPQKALSADTAANVSQQINGKAITNIFESDGLKVKNATLADNAANVTTNINGKAITNIFESDGITAKTASKLGTASVGSSSKPIYLSSGVPSEIQYTLGAACQRSLSDSTIASALSSTDINVPTVRDIYYGTPTINGSKSYTSSTNIYAPTSAGTKSYLLVSNGTTTPSWKSVNSAVFQSVLLNTTNKYVSFYGDSIASQFQVVSGTATASGSSATDVSITFPAYFSYTPTVVATYFADANTERYYSWIRNVSTKGFTCRGYGGYKILWIAVGA